MLIVIIIILICILINRYKNKLSTKKLKLDSIYSEMKTGDIILADDYIYILYLVDNDIKVITRDISGYIRLLKVNDILKQYKKVFWFRLIEDLSNSQKQSIEQYIHIYYPKTVPINCVFIFNGKRKFCKMHLYTAKILNLLNIIRIDLAFDCLTDPLECIRGFYNNSVFLSGQSFEKNMIQLI